MLQWLGVALRLCNETVLGTWETPCVYCGMPATTKDHFVPRAYRKLVLTWATEKRWKGAPNVVPACGQCNSTAGGRVFDTLSGKRAWIQNRYRDRFAKTLAIPLRTDAEVGEYGAGLRPSVARYELDKVRLLLRLWWPYDVGDEVQALTVALLREGQGLDEARTAVLNDLRRREVLA